MLVIFINEHMINSLFDQTYFDLKVFIFKNKVFLEKKSVLEG